MNLAGPWRAHPADEDLRRAFPDDRFDDHDWETVAVPGHWRCHRAFGEADGPVLYRTRFEQARPGPPQRRWLRLEGVFSQADVWLDGAYLGDTEGYFCPRAFEITEASQARPDHVLGIEVGCAPPGPPGARRSLTGAFQDGAHVPPTWNPGGLWRPVQLFDTGPVAIRHGRVLCREATEARGLLAMRVVLDTDDARTAVLRTRVAGTEHVLSQPLASGENRVEWSVAVPRPSRWWPHALGPQPLHDVRVQVELETGEVSDHRAWRTGFRAVELRNWIARVNGERLFLKGANLSPVRRDPATASADDWRQPMRWAREAGLDLVRLHTHVAHPELYRAADELGLLVWQDLPLHGQLARSIRREAMRQAREAVDLVGHHPSVAIWCVHDEPHHRPGDARRPAAGRGLIHQQVPSWNRSLLDRSVKRVLERSDGTRPVIAHSGVLPHLPQLDGTDAHLWFGWYGGEAEDLASHAARLPRQVRFVSAFGAQAPPAETAFFEPHRWPDLDWDRLAAEHGLEVEAARRVVPPDQHDTFESWAEALRTHQARLVRQCVETLRRLKYRPTGGFTVHRLHDPTPQVGFGLRGADGRPKPAWDALVAACRPTLVTADVLPATLTPGDHLELAVHAVTDERVDRRDAVVRAWLTAPATARVWRWQGDLPADSCVRIGTIRWEVPATPGPVTLELSLEPPHDAVGANRYASCVRGG